MKAKLHFLVPLVALFAFLQMAYWQGAQYQYEAWVVDTQRNLEQRIALDAPGLHLSNPLFAQVADVESIKRYIGALNQQLQLQNAPLRLLALQDISPGEFSRANAFTTELLTVNNRITVSLVRQPMPLAQSLSAWPIALTVMIGFLMLRGQQRRRALQDQISTSVPEVVPHLIIDLKDKTLALSGTEHSVKLSNKPFCFYSALLDYCESNPEAKLNQSKDLPQELLELANKYFYRLMDLGHTRRKRPDFNTNLDKTLSEIRAALDELFVDHNELKSCYYPPKAQGEGSRSKLHNFGLIEIGSCNLEFVGK